MESNSIIELLPELCLPARTQAALKKIVFDEGMLPESRDYLLHDLATTCFDQEPLQSRYYANRLRFPHASQQFIAAAKQYWADRGCSPEQATSVDEKHFGLAMRG